MIDIKKTITALTKLKELFNNWGIKKKQWILCYQYAELLQGYNIIQTIREGHLNIAVQQEAIPWELNKSLLGIETTIPLNSRYHKQTKNFHKQSGFEFDLIPFSKKGFNNLLSNSKVYKLPSGNKIQILSVLGTLNVINNLDPNKLGDKIFRILRHLNEIIFIAKIKNDKFIYNHGIKIGRKIKNKISSDISFEKRWQAKHSLYRLEAVLRAYVDFSNIPACECQNMLISMRKSVATTYFDKYEMSVAPRIGLRFIKNKQLIKKYVRDGKVLCRKLVRISKDISLTNLNNLSNKKLKELYLTYFKYFTGLFAYYNLSRPDYSSGVYQYVNNYITKKEPNIKKQKNIFFILTRPTKNSLLALHEIEQLKFVREILKSKANKKIKNIRTFIRQNKKLRDRLSSLIKNCSWVSTQENNPPLDEDYYLNRIKTWKLSKINYKIKFLINTPKRLQKQKQKIIKKYKISKYFVGITNSIADLADIRLNIRLWWTESSFYARNLFKELNCRAGFENKKYGNFYYSEYLLKDEVEAFLRKKKKISSKQIKERIRHCLLLMENKRIELFISKKADQIEKKYIKKIQDYSGITEIKGFVANKGLVRGKAWVISPSVANQVKKARIMKKGHILVVAMTRPQFIEGISKSSAIVTDEGGITCHAAIVSRELGKPCIIGTKIATKILRDGDLVEVDANKGVVRIIKKK